MNAQTNCSGAYLTISGGALTSYTGAHLRITGGAVTVTGSVTLDYCDIIVDNNVYIGMTPGSVLTITNSTHIYSCSPSMWAGIHNVTGAQVIINGNSLIEDSQNAVVMASGGIFQIEDVVFNKNFSSIYFPSSTIAAGSYIRHCFFTSRAITPVSTYFTSGGMLNSSNFSVDDAVWQSTGTLTWASATMNGSTNVGQIGIWAISVTNLLQIGDDASTSYLNTFDNLSKGINLTYTNAVIYNNSFWNISKNTAIGKTGTAIFAQGAPNGTGSITIGGNATGTFQQNLFKDNFTAIDVRFYQNMDIINNYIKQTIATTSIATSGTGWYGITIIPGGTTNQARIHILNNSIYNSSTGIRVYRQTTGFTATEITVGENLITSNGTATLFCRTAIDLLDANLYTTMARDKYKVRNNWITNVYNGVIATNIGNNSPSYVGSLIILRDAAFYPISWTSPPDIEIIPYPTPGSNTYCAVEIDNCPFGRIYNNTITTANPTSLVATAFNYKGIYVKQCKYTEELCNAISYYYEAMSYYGNCDISFIRNNSMDNGTNNAGNGLALRTGGIIGDQGTAVDDCGLTWNCNSFVNQTFVDGFTSDPSLIPYSRLFVDYGGPICPSFVTLPTTNAGGLNAYGASSLLPTTAGTAINCATVPVFMHVNGGGQLKSLGIDSAQYFAAQIRAMVNDTNNYAIYADEERYQNKIRAFAILDTTGGATADTTGMLQAFYDSTASAAIGQFKNVNDAIANQDYATATAINKGITTGNTIEANTKLVNQYLLLEETNPNYIYSASDSAAIYSIAIQCPSAGGLIVWSARALYFNIVGHRVSFDDNCVYSVAKNIIPKTTQLDINFKLYPNPNNGNMIVEYHLNDNENAEVSIYDLVGRILRSYSINSKNTTFNISESLLNAGTYYYSIRVNDKVVKTEKLIIIK